MKMSKLGYFSEFLLFPPIILIATLYAFRTSTLRQAAIWAFLYAVGLVCWTLIEYFLHRVFFHHAPLLSQIHERHHQSPQDLIGTPAWVSVMLGLIFAAIPSYALLGFDLGIAITAGLVTGYLWYVFVHYATHHWVQHRDSYLYRARLRHARHHYVSHDGNFGVTTAVWDHIFGTAIESRAPRSSDAAFHNE
jgi:sterol desaturase/sphingolipid hydroxylase (fatty acid hydroxylase superfamily)